VNAQVVTVGMAEPKHAERYCGKLAPSVTCLADESHQAYAVYGLGKASTASLLSPGMLRAAVGAYRGGHRQGSDTAGGDVMMLPGTFVVDRAGIVRYAYYSVHAGDHPEVAELISALRQID
jgi:peroxiredoxin